jgi:hypothetical protein
MVALLSQCFDQGSNSSSNNNTNSNTNYNTNSNNDLKIPEVSPVRNVSDQNVPTKTIETGPNILEQQFKELKDYTRHLEKEVEEYKKYIEERFNNINNQQFNVLEGFSNNNDNSNNSKDINDILVYLMTCVFVLLLVDYIFKMGKNSY